MSTKHIRTTADLVRFRASVTITCASCGAARTMSGPKLVKACGTEPLPALPARLRCGGRDARVAVFTARLERARTTVDILLG